MNAGLGIGGLFIIAVIWFVVKPLLVGLFHGLAGLIAGRGNKNQ